jgi:hypothetical protein
VNLTEVHDLADIQRLYILLSRKSPYPPSAGGQADSFYRLMRIGKKKLPSTREHNRFWGIVEEVTDEVPVIQGLLGSGSYSTITQGERSLQACRPAGQGYYAIVQSQASTHLVYVLELPQETGEVQRTLNIDKEASYFLSIKNPQVNLRPATDSNRPGLPNQNVAAVLPQSPVPIVLPTQLQESFGGRAWAPALPLDLLNFKGIEFVIIGETNNIVKEFGFTGQEIEEEEQIDAEHLQDENLFAELRLAQSVHPPEPLLYGQWR